MNLTLQATPEQVMVAVEALQALCHERKIGPEETYALMLALEETCTNVVKHAYGGDARRRFHVTASLAEGVVALEVRDDGPEFDPLAPRPLPPDHDPEDPPIGGLGIPLMQRSVDAVRYRREGGENVLHMEKRI